MAPPVDPDMAPVLDAKVDAYVDALARLEPHSPDFAGKAEDVRTMGDEDIREAAQASNRLLSTPVKALEHGGLAEGSRVGGTLLELRRTVEQLDPQGAVGVKWFARLPFGNRMTDYFRKYQDAQGHLAAILHSLRQGQDELQRDNVALAMEKRNLWEAMRRLHHYLYATERLDARLSALSDQLESQDPERARALQQDVLFYVRQKHQDLLTQLAVSIQSYLAIDVVVKNNTELIKGVDRASTTTVSALRTAVIAAQAMGNQRLVLDQISALTTTTSDMIERTSRMLLDNSARLHEQASSATVGLPQLQAAFQNIYATMDAIDAFKVQALDTMSATIGTLESEVAKSRTYLDRVGESAGDGDRGSLDLGLSDRSS